MLLAWIDSILGPSAFGLAPIAFHTCKPCMLHGHVAFGYLLPICLCAPTCLPVRCNHTMDNELIEWLLHGNPKQISMLYIQTNPMDLLYVVARIIIIAIKCKKIMLHILARIIIIAIKCRKSCTILMKFVILLSFFNKFMFPPKHYMLKDSIERN